MQEDDIEIMQRQQVPILYYIGFVSFILFFMGIEMAWSYPKSIFIYISILALCMHLLTAIRKYTPPQLILLIVLSFIVILVGINAHQLTLLFLSFSLVVGAKGMDYKTILKVHFVTGLTLFLISFVGSTTGFIENKVDNISLDSMDMLGATSTKRYSYGYVWPTDCANHLSFICLVYWLMKDGLLKFKELFLFACAFLFVFEFVKARQSALIILMMIIVAFYLQYLFKRQRYPYRVAFYYLVISIPLFAVISMLATIAYEETDVFWIATDLVFSGRLRLGQEAIMDYGLPWFGQFVLMVGGDANSLEYNYVDSSYVQAFLQWGIVLTTVLILVFFLICKKAYVRRDVSLLFAIFFAGLSSVTSQFLFQISFCPLIIALLSDHQISDYVKER